MTRPLHFKEIPENERPLSEQYRLAGEAWAEADGAARLMEELKSSALESRKSQLILERGDMPDNKAERLVKSSASWDEYLREMVRLRVEANKKRVAMEWLKFKHAEWQTLHANNRHESRLSRG